MMSMFRRYRIIPARLFGNLSVAAGTLLAAIPPDGIADGTRLAAAGIADIVRMTIPAALFVSGTLAVAYSVIVRHPATGGRREPVRAGYPGGTFRNIRRDDDIRFLGFRPVAVSDGTGTAGRSVGSGGSVVPYPYRNIPVPDPVIRNIPVCVFYAGRII